MTDDQIKTLDALAARHGSLSVEPLPSGDLRVVADLADRAWIIADDGRCISSLVGGHDHESPGEPCEACGEKWE